MALCAPATSTSTGWTKSQHVARLAIEDRRVLRLQLIGGRRQHVVHEPGVAGTPAIRDELLRIRRPADRHQLIRVALGAVVGQQREVGPSAAAADAGPRRAARADGAHRDVVVLDERDAASVRRDAPDCDAPAPPAPPRRGRRHRPAPPRGRRDRSALSPGGRARRRRRRRVAGHAAADGGRAHRRVPRRPAVRRRARARALILRERAAPARSGRVDVDRGVVAIGVCEFAERQCDGARTSYSLADVSAVASRA